MEILKVSNLNFEYRNHDIVNRVLENINLSFETGKIYAILGVSGSGKTTFLSQIAYFESIQSGEIKLEEKSITQIPSDIYHSQYVSFVFQNYNLVPYLNGYQNVRLAMDINNKIDKSERKEKAYEFLEKVGISKEMANRRISRLSGGEQQRIAIARAISSNAKVIMADEPTGNLDQKTGQVIIDIFKKLAYEEDKCIIIATHSNLIASQANVVLELNSNTKNFVEKIHENN